jgi:hypothetical protein
MILIIVVITIETLNLIWKISFSYKKLGVGNSVPFLCPSTNFINFLKKLINLNKIY